MKTAVILDSGLNGTHPMEAVLDRRGFTVVRVATVEEAVHASKSDAGVDIVIVETPLNGSSSQMEAAVQLHDSVPEIPLLLVSDLPVEKWSEADYLQFGQLSSGHIDLLVKPLSQASFVAKANSLITTITYLDSKKLFVSAGLRRLAAVAV